MCLYGDELYHAQVKIKFMFMLYKWLFKESKLIKRDHTEFHVNTIIVPANVTVQYFFPVM